MKQSSLIHSRIILSQKKKKTTKEKKPKHLKY